MKLNPSLSKSTRLILKLPLMSFNGLIFLVTFWWLLLIVSHNLETCHRSACRRTENYVIIYLLCCLLPGRSLLKFKQSNQGFILIIWCSLWWNEEPAFRRLVRLWVFVVNQYAWIWPLIDAWAVFETVMKSNLRFWYVVRQHWHVVFQKSTNVIYRKLSYLPSY